MDTNVEKKSIQENVNERIRLNLSYINYNNIIDMKLPYKFSYLDDWLLKASKLLLVEASSLKNNSIQLFRTYGRGTIVKIDFGIGIGSEMSQVHFGIVLNNFDNPKNNTLTVIPLSSKNSKFYINLGELFKGLFIDDIQKNIKLIEENEILSVKEKIKIKKLNLLQVYYQNYIKTTFACPYSITTISKERIFAPLNEYDRMGKVKCPIEKMRIIDEAIKQTYLTNKR